MSFWAFRRSLKRLAFPLVAYASTTVVSSTVDEMERKIPYLLIGGGTASYYTALTIRARDPDAKVLIISDEKNTPYNRPALSKELWWYANEKTPTNLTYTTPSGRRKDIRYEADGFYPSLKEMDSFEHGCISIILNNRVVNLDTENNSVELENGQKIIFDKCLIATGSKPKPFNMLKNENNTEKYVTFLNNIEDYQKLESLISGNNIKKIAIIGNDLLGMEMAHSLKKYKKNLEIFQIFSDSDILENMLPKHLSSVLANETTLEGIKILNNSILKGVNISQETGEVILEIERNLCGKNSQENFTCEHIIVGIGNDPNVELAKLAGLKLDENLGGIFADSGMHVQDNIWSAGAVCSFHDETLGKRRRLNQWEHAQISGRVAGANMTNDTKTYTHQSAFTSVLCGSNNLNGVGEINSDLKTVTVILKDNESNKKEAESFKAIVFYLNDQRVVGVLFYNVFGFGIEIARKIITDGEKHEDFLDLVKLMEPFPELIKEDKEDNEKETELISSI